MTTEQLAQQMWSQIKSGSTLANGRLSGPNVEFAISYDDGQVRLTMSRDNLGYPFAHEIEYARRAFGIPDETEPRYLRPWRNKPVTKRAYQPYVVEFTWRQDQITQ